MEVPILMCSPSVKNALGLLPSCNSPSGEPTPTILPYNLSSFPALLVILPSNPLSSLGGKKIYFLILAMREKSKNFFCMLVTRHTKKDDKG
jgi:hypothetical protein